MIRRWNLDGTGLTVVSDTSLPRQTNNQVSSGDLVGVRRCACLTATALGDTYAASL